MSDQGVTSAYRFVTADKSIVRNVRLNFSVALPEYVILNYIRYSIRPYTPNPRQCKRCHGLRHLETACRSTVSCCRKCGVPHDISVQCAMKCVNCKSADHDAYNRACPAWVSLKEAIKISVAKNLPIKEAVRLRDNHISSTLGEGWSTVAVSQDGEDLRELKRTVATLQDKVLC